MAGPCLLLCVGATKSGTSWLYEALAAHPECHLRSIKELHYFDALEDGRLDRAIDATRAERDRFAARMEEAPLARLPELAQKLADREDWLRVLERGEDTDAYLGYLSDGAGAARVVGDVTPAYALLPEARLARMARLAEDTRVLYLMRDPVARLWSHVRMIATRRGGGTLSAEKARNILNRTLRGKESEIERRGDYRAALARLRAAVPAERLMVMFYEDLVAPGGIERICGFLGIAPRAADTGQRVHAGERLDMPAGLRDKARDWLAPQYDEVARMGPLPEAWQANMVRV